MSIFDKLRRQKQPEEQVQSYFKMFDGYAPAFKTFEGSLYEMDLTRSVIHSFATHCSKLNMEIKGNSNLQLKRQINTKVNRHTTTSAYLYRLATIYQVRNNAFVIADEDPDSDRITGFYPILPDNAEVVKHQGNKYLRFLLAGKRMAIELDRVGIINQFQFQDEHFGASNNVMRPTLSLMRTQEQGMAEAIKHGASIRFMAKLANAIRDDDLQKERDRFGEMNLSRENATGVMIFDNKYEDVKQVHSRPYTIDAAQMKEIKESVYTHFGTNGDILQNSYNSNSWSAYYEGVIEPFAIKASQAHTLLTFTDREQAHGNEIMLTANRLQYLSNPEKLQTVTQLFDRGFLTHNEGREIFNMSPIDGGDVYFIRKEYSETQKLDEGTGEITEYEGMEDSELGDDDAEEQGEGTDDN